MKNLEYQFEINVVGKEFYISHLQRRTLTPLDTWSCPTLGIACVLMSRPISPELV